MLEGLIKIIGDEAHGSFTIDAGRFQMRFDVKATSAVCSVTVYYPLDRRIVRGRLAFQRDASGYTEILNENLDEIEELALLVLRLAWAFKDSGLMDYSFKLELQDEADDCIEPVIGFFPVVAFAPCGGELRAKKIPREDFLGLDESI